jgi:hypothetical protein
MTAEGIPTSSGYVVPLYKQPLFEQKNFGPYNACMREYRGLHLPTVERICAGEGAWLTQNLLLGTRADVDDIVAAMRKVYEYRGHLR